LKSDEICNIQKYSLFIELCPNCGKNHTFFRPHPHPHLATTKQLINAIQDLQSEKNLTDGLIISYEIANLYFEYIIKPVFHHKLRHVSWEKFTDKLSTLEQEIDCIRMDYLERGEPVNESLLYEKLTNYLEPLQKDIRLSLTDIRYLKNDRRDVCHLSSKSVASQLALIEKAKAFPFSDKFEHKRLVEEMIADVEKCKTRFQKIGK
jgi:hypothetical protein